MLQVLYGTNRFYYEVEKPFEEGQKDLNKLKRCLSSAKAPISYLGVGPLTWQPFTNRIIETHSKTSHGFFPKCKNLQLSHHNETSTATSLHQSTLKTFLESRGGQCLLDARTWDDSSSSFLTGNALKCERRHCQSLSLL